MSEIIRSPYKLLLLGGLFAFIITAFFSNGYFHADEHFQILEFANYKRGLTPASELPWEFNEKIRPALQPSLALGAVTFLGWMGIESPFTQVLILRLLTAFLSWFVISKLALLLVDQFKNEWSRKLFIGLAVLLWFVPFISVRFSSENYASITFWAAIFFVLDFYKHVPRQSNYKLILAGVLLGLSFFFRFQMAFAMAGLGLWLLFVQKAKWKNILVLVFPALMVMLICVGIDTWFYEETVFTPFNYFYQNIVENRAAEFGETPWWDYFKLFIEKAIPPFSLVFLILFFVGGYRNKSSVFLWVFVPFLLGHMAVGHKELRFLFPMVFAFIFLVSLGIDAFITRYKYRKSWNWLLIPALIINFTALSAYALTPTQVIINYYKFLYDESRDAPVLLVCKDQDIYEVVGIPIYFYKKPRVKTYVVKDDFELQRFLETAKPKRVLLLEKDFTLDVKYKNYEDRMLYCAYPQWIEVFNFGNWIQRSRIYMIHELRLKS